MAQQETATIRASRLQSGLIVDEARRKRRRCLYCCTGFGVLPRKVSRFEKSKVNKQSAGGGLCTCLLQGPQKRPGRQVASCKVQAALSFSVAYSSRMHCSNLG